MVLSCIDPRFQSKVFDFLNKKNLRGKYSCFTVAGAAIGVTAPKFKKWHTTFWDNLDTSIKIHKIKKLLVINHRDCGAAKIINGKKEFNNYYETEIHQSSFKRLKTKFKKKYPKLKIETLLMSLNDNIEKF